MLATWVADFELRLTLLGTGVGWGLTCSSLFTFSSPVPLPLLVPRLRRLGRSLFMLGGICAYLVFLWYGCGGSAFCLKIAETCPGRRQEDFGDVSGVTVTKNGGSDREGSDW